MKRVTALGSAHVPEKWLPAFRTGHASTPDLGAHPHSAETGCALEPRCRPSRRFWFTTALISPLLLSPLAAAPASAGTAPALTCPAVMNLKIANVQFLSATPVAATQTLPAYCNAVGVIGKYVSKQDPQHDTYGIVFELNLPNSWNGRFEQQGGGGLDGSVTSPIGEAGTELSQGWAVAASDGGHENAPGNGYTPPAGVTWNDQDNNAGGTGHFAVDEQARINYGYNSVQQTTTVSLQIIAQYYGKPAQYSYFWGCSDGGREAMFASQNFPELYNGIVAGNPGFNLPQAAVAEAWNEQALAPLATSLDANNVPDVATTFTTNDLEVAAAAILQACDGLDGLIDGIVDNYSACTNEVVFKAFRNFTCPANTPPHSGYCLVPEQIQALKKIYAGPVNSKNQPLYSFWYWDAGIWDPPSAGVSLGWQAWNVGCAFCGPPTYNTAANLTLGAAAVPMVFTTPPVVTPVNGTVTSQEGYIFNYNFDTDAPKIFATTSACPQSAMEFMSATSTDLFQFQNHGGKLIIYDSVNDGIFSAVSLVNWYKSLPSPQSFARLFLVPNMAHCGGGAATNSFSGNLLTAITNWAERGSAPDQIIAANTGQVSPYPTGGGGLFNPLVAQNFPTGGTRPLCPYPQQTRYKGYPAPTNHYTGFSCVAP